MVCSRAACMVRCRIDLRHKWSRRMDNKRIDEWAQPKQVSMNLNVFSRFVPKLRLGKLARIFCTHTHRSLAPFRWNALIPSNDKMDFSPFILAIEWLFWRVNAHTEISIFFFFILEAKRLIKYSRLLWIFGCVRSRAREKVNGHTVNSRPIYAVCNQLKWFESSVERFKHQILKINFRLANERNVVKSMNSLLKRQKEINFIN